MENIKMVLSEYGYFGFVFAFVIGILLLVIIRINTNKKYKPNAFFAGLLLKITNGQIWTLTLIIINYLILTYTLMYKISMNPYISVISFILISTGFLITFDTKKLLKNSTINAFNILFFYIIILIGRHVELGSFKILLIILCFAFITFSHLVFINDDLLNDN